MEVHKEHSMDQWANGPMGTLLEVSVLGVKDIGQGYWAEV